jgi:thiamine-phosphate pyrophosphorylase
LIDRLAAAQRAAVSCLRNSRTHQSFNDRAIPGPELNEFLVSLLRLRGKRDLSGRLTFLRCTDDNGSQVSGDIPPPTATLSRTVKELPVSDWSDRLSSSARRVLTAAQVAASAVDRPPQARDLLQAMLDDEGHATELLRGCDVSAVAADVACVLEISLPRLVRRASQLARSGEETSSLHLLAALVLSDAAIAAHLQLSGLRVEELLQQTCFDNAQAQPPLPVSIRIAPAAPPVNDLSSTWRVLDAAANRAREGLRVLEDFARFSLDDTHLTTRLKQLRHKLAALEQRLLGDAAVRFRNTPHDVGTRIHTAFESTRESEADVVRANARRVQEAVRTLEEFGKRIDSHAAALVGDVRYQAYTLEQALLSVFTSRRRLADVRLCLLATDALCPRGVGPVVREALAGGCPMVQLREKNVPDGQLIARARFLREWTRETGALLVINDRPDIAVLVDADGVHLGQEDLPAAEARRIVGGDRLVGVSTHNVEQLRQAVLDGADYLGVGPVFSSTTKTFNDLAGLDFVRAAAAETGLPWFAIGGLDAENLPSAIQAGARRIAVTGAICRADDPRLATRLLLNQLQAVAAT